MSGIHPSEDDLILHVYGEGPDGASIEAHLASCPDCSRRFAVWGATLRAVEDEPVPDAGADYGARVWERLRPHLPDKRAPRATLFRRFRVPLAVAASLVAAFLLWRSLPPRGEPTPPLPGPARERILLLAVGDHLERSRMVLLELVNADPKTPVDVSAEQRSVGELVAASRLYRQSARRAGDVGVASVLDDLERILIEVANGPARLSPSEAEALRQRLERQGTLFKMRVIGTRVGGAENRAPEHHPAGMDVDS
jgi:anti-sigma factor RsiW